MLPPASAGVGRGGSSVSEGESANDIESMAPAAMVTPPDASNRIACMSGIVCRIRGNEMTKDHLDMRHNGTGSSLFPSFPFDRPTYLHASVRELEDLRSKWRRYLANPQIEDGTIRATAHLPGLKIEIVHSRSPTADAEQISINLRAVPSFDALGRALQTASPFVFWARSVTSATPKLGTRLSSGGGALNR